MLHLRVEYRIQLRMPKLPVPLANFSLDQGKVLIAEVELDVIPNSLAIFLDPHPIPFGALGLPNCSFALENQLVLMAGCFQKSCLCFVIE